MGTALGIIAIVIAIGSAVYEYRLVDRLLHKSAQIKEDVDFLKENAYIRGQKGRFEKLVPKPKPEELVPGVTSELEHPRVGD